VAEMDAAAARDPQHDPRALHGDRGGRLGIHRSTSWCRTSSNASRGRATGAAP
jgi:hypothetical protein